MEVHPKVNPAGNPLSIRVLDPTSPASKCNLKKHGIWAGVIALIALLIFLAYLYRRKQASQQQLQAHNEERIRRMLREQQVQSLDQSDPPPYETYASEIPLQDLRTTRIADRESGGRNRPRTLDSIHTSPGRGRRWVDYGASFDNDRT
jgi:hypothetical protein